METITKTALMYTLWLVNPIIGCSPEPKFEFDESDMIDLMDDVTETVWTSEQESIQYKIAR